MKGGTTILFRNGLVERKKNANVNFSRYFKQLLAHISVFLNEPKDKVTEK